MRPEQDSKNCSGREREAVADQGADRAHGYTRVWGMTLKTDPDITPWAGDINLPVQA